MSSQSLNISCPEHEDCIEYVCLFNSCYQKLLCNKCMKKHKFIHLNDQVPLSEFFSDMKKFHSTKLLQEEDLSGYQEQVKNGHKLLRDSEGKVSQWITLAAMRSIDGKDEQTKWQTFEDKSTKVRQKLQDKEVCDINNSLKGCMNLFQKKILGFEKRLSESIDKQLYQSTTQKLLELKYIKDIAIQNILEAFSKKQDRYNKLNKTLIKLHKGYLELKISKKLFREMCVDINSKLKVFSQNIFTYFDQEVNKLFSFILDDLDKIDNMQNINKEVDFPKSDKKGEDHKIQMEKMIDQLKEIKSQTEKQIKSKDLHFQEQIPYTYIDNRSRKVSKRKLEEQAKSLDYQKKEEILDLRQIESQRYSLFQTKLNSILSPTHSSSSRKSLCTSPPTSSTSLASKLKQEDNRPFSSKSFSEQIQLKFNNEFSPQNPLQFNPSSQQQHEINKNNSFKYLNVKLTQQQLKKSVNFKIQSPISTTFNQSTSQLNEQTNSIKSLQDLQKTSLLSTLPSPTIRSINQLDIKMTYKSSHISHLPEQAKSLMTQDSSYQQKLGDIPSKLQQQQQQVFNFSSDESTLINYQSGEKSNVVGMESISSTKIMLIHQNGLLQVWELSANSQKQENENGIIENDKIQKKQQTRSISSFLTTSIAKCRELNLCKRITSYCQMQDTPLYKREQFILAISGQNESQNESLIFIVKYEHKKNRFSKIDSIKYENSFITCIACAADKFFKKNNLPSSFQLLTDAFYLFTLNPFSAPSNNDNDYYLQTDSNLKNKQTSSILQFQNNYPIIEVRRVQFHREKLGSVENQSIYKEKISQTIIIHKLLFNPFIDCLFAHSDFQLLKWSFNFNNGALESHKNVVLCEKQDDSITSMHINDHLVVLSSQLGNLWSTDIMLNKVFAKDCMKFKYSKINNYTSKIQGKDTIKITSGSVIFIQIPQTQQYESLYVYSTVSASGLKLYCFRHEFKEVAAIIGGQLNHIQHVASFDSIESSLIIVGVEQFDQIRLYPSNLIKKINLN